MAKFVLLVILFPLLLHAKPKVWKPADGSKIAVKIKYTLGTHDLSTSTVGGVLEQKGAEYESASGTIEIPIESITEGNPKLECHLREALGLDYQKSGFPESHVCSGEYKLPITGPDSIVFPMIKLAIKKLQHIEYFKYKVIGDWTIHGVTKPVENLFVEVKPDPSGLSVSGSAAFKLKDFGVVVKKAFVISVADQATTEFNVKFASD